VKTNIVLASKQAGNIDCVIFFMAFI